MREKGIKVATFAREGRQNKDFYVKMFSKLEMLREKVVNMATFARKSCQNGDFCAKQLSNVKKTLKIYRPRILLIEGAWLPPFGFATTEKSFWDALGLGIRSFLCFTSSSPDSDRGRLISSVRVRNNREELLGRTGAQYLAVFVFYIVDRGF